MFFVLFNDLKTIGVYSTVKIIIKYVLFNCRITFLYEIILKIKQVSPTTDKHIATLFENTYFGHK